MFFKEQITKERRKQQNWGLHNISVLGRYPQETQVKDCTDRKKFPAVAWIHSSNQIKY